MEQKAARLSLSKDKQVELMERYSTITSLSDAEVKLEKLEKSRLPTGDSCCCIVLIHCLLHFVDSIVLYRGHRLFEGVVTRN